MAAAAYDVAAFHFKGFVVRLNFPDLVDGFPKPASSSAEDVRLAAQEAAMRFKRPAAAAPVAETPSRSGGPAAVRVGLSDSQIEAINDTPMDSPSAIWMQLGTSRENLEGDWRHYGDSASLDGDDTKKRHDGDSASLDGDDMMVPRRRRDRAWESGTLGGKIATARQRRRVEEADKLEGMRAEA
nr:DREB transcription factor [Ipomoea batatas]